MSVAALQFWKGLSKRKAELRLCSTDLLVLRAVALHYNDEVGCCYAPLPNLAAEACQSERTTQLKLAELVMGMGSGGKEVKGRKLLRRFATEYRRGGAAANEYEFVGLESGLTAEALEAARGRVFRFDRKRVARVVQSALALREEAPAVGLSPLGSGASVELSPMEEGPVGLSSPVEHGLVGHYPVEMAPVPLDWDAVGLLAAAVDISETGSPPLVQTVLARPGADMASPHRGFVVRSIDAFETPQLGNVQNADERLPDIAKARTTASATATATTSSRESAAVAGGERGKGQHMAGRGEMSGRARRQQWKPGRLGDGERVIAEHDAAKALWESERGKV